MGWAWVIHFWIVWGASQLLGDENWANVINRTAYHRFH